MINSNALFRLTSNENCYGCSPSVFDAISKKYRDVPMYPEMNPVLLREKLAEKFGVSIHNIIVDAGSVRVIDRLIQTFVGEGEEVLTFEKSFIAYSQLSAYHKRKCIFAPLSNFSCTPENLLPFIHQHTRIIFIANPNNPTGTIITHAQLHSFLKQIPENIIVVIDEAYGEYVTDKDYPQTQELQKEFPNVVILHSFSKIYGLAGIRIGFAILNEHLATRMAVTQMPYTLGYLASVAAIAALHDEEFIRQSVIKNAVQRDYLFHEMVTMNFHTVPSQSNFAYVWFDDDEEKKKIHHEFANHGIHICDMSIFGQDKSLRITIGDSIASTMIVDVMHAFMHNTVHPA